MAIDGIFKGLAPSVSGLRAERTRMDVVASNIANANSIQADGTPYTRKMVLFQPALEAALEGEAPGVRVEQVVEDASPHPEVYKPGHPHADENGYVRLPNVNLATEMVDLSSSVRTYEANLAAVKAFRDIGQQALQIGTR